MGKYTEKLNKEYWPVEQRDAFFWGHLAGQMDADFRKQIEKHYSKTFGVVAKRKLGWLNFYKALFKMKWRK